MIKECTHTWKRTGDHFDGLNVIYDEYVCTECGMLKLARRMSVSAQKAMKKQDPPLRLSNGNRIPEILKRAREKHAE